MLNRKTLLLSDCLRRAYHWPISTYSSTSNQAIDAKAIIEKQLRAEITPPAAKKRSNTTVLKALQSTIKSAVLPPYSDPPSPHLWNVYTGNDAVRQGENAANYVIQKKPELFQHNWNSDNVETWIKMSSEAQFNIDDKIPKKEISGKEKEEICADSVENIQSLIDNFQLNEATAMYLRLHSESVTMPDDITNNLLAFLALYRSPADVIASNSRPMEILLPWKFDKNVDTSNFIQIFETLSSPSSEQHMLMIAALTMNSNKRQAYEWYMQKLRAKGFLPDITTFNNLILSGTPIGVSSRTGKGWLNEMAKAGLTPNHGTFIHLLFLHHSQSVSQLISYYSSVIKEMDALGLDLSPGLFLGMISQPLMSSSDMFVLLNSILDLMEGRELVVVDKVDMFGFYRLLRKAENHYEVVKRIWKLVHYGKNHNIILKSSNYLQTTFYNTYLLIVIRNDTLENSWSAIQNLVPARTQLYESHLMALLKSIENAGHPEYLPVVFAAHIGIRTKVKLRKVWSTYALNMVHLADDEVQGQIVQIALANAERCNMNDEVDIAIEMLLNCLQIVMRCGTQPEISAIVKQVKFQHKQNGFIVPPNIITRCKEAMKRFDLTSDLRAAISTLERSSTQKTEKISTEYTNLLDR